MTARIKWTDELETQLRTLWEQDVSTRKIAATLRMSKSAITGKADRMGLPMRDRLGLPLRETKARASEIVVAPPPPPPPVVVLLVPKDEPKPIGPWNNFPDERRACRFIQGTPNDGKWRCCGAPTAAMDVYCPYHMVKCFQVQPVRRKVA